MTSENDYKHLVGKTLIEVGQEDNFQRTDNHVYESDLPENRRVIKPGYAYTCDYVEDRLCVEIDESSIIKSVNYG
ncbi:hypothetical protein CONCODRAFT_15542 [Conidiobolus coronatus NRRL 28638]|uniref:Uncharacterized protein n=1 Tax=Conidiobolus coronatus (strain ATCC 28846 / CBS 209.66 / NRRL 28638) TaxID=796925 RepID=A0A137PEN2_CONC2|nr:hypothetical protein CONCODRAFT_15542 [Conidiobolus coronatus NRRL 28638]|eukprot:KXN73411.1 hypothetical protein CONCODRAFT_15542 [Conidiobolus coronatus NRRL 28638]